MKNNQFDRDVSFLEGPKQRLVELWNVMHIGIEFIKGFRTFHFVGHCISFFGSARYTEDHIHYQQARELAAMVSEMGYTIMTGGGGGIMEAANRGARDAGGPSVGCNTKLPKEQMPNPYMDKCITLEHFYVRKVILTKYSCGFVIMPGGIGTLDEFFEVFTLLQTGKIKEFPIVLFDTIYWQNLIEQLCDMKVAGTISPNDIDKLLITDSIIEAAEYLKEKAARYWKKTQPKLPKKQPLLWE